MTSFEKCRKQFRALAAPVNDDPRAQTTVSDLYSAALFELDLHEEGGQDPPLTAAQVRQLRRFVERWKPATPTCRWFLNCTNPAATTVEHPILGAVPCCTRCAARAGQEAR